MSRKFRKYEFYRMPILLTTTELKLEGARESANLREVNFYRRPLFESF